MRSDSDGRTRARTGSRKAIAGCFIGVPLLIAGAIMALFAARNGPVHIAVPTPTIPNPNAYDDFARAARLAEAMKHKTPASMPTPVYTYAAFRDAAADAQPAIAAMRPGFTRDCLFPVSRSLHSPGPPFTDLSAMRELARVMSGVGIYYEMDGRWAQDADALLDCLEMAVMLPQGGNLVTALVGNACEAIAISRFELAIPNLNDVELAHVAARLDVIEGKRAPFATMVLEEGYEQTAMYAEALNDPKSRNSFETARTLLAEDDPAATGTTRKLNARETWRALQFVMADKTQMLKENEAYYEACAAECRGVFAGPIKTPLPINLLAQVGGDTITLARQKFASMQAARAVIRTEIALRRYWLAHRRYPSRLSDLGLTNIQRQQLVDPCGGAPLRYTALDGGHAFKLYSIGPDLIDNGGVPSRFVGSLGGDIVAGALRKNKALTRSGK